MRNHLNVDLASRLARLALAGIETEYPNKPGDVLVDAQTRRSPRQMHPVFFGCYDWHSAVHSHWMLVRLLRAMPHLVVNAEIRATLRGRLTLPLMQIERAFFDEPVHRSFERMYGWAWLLRLAAELGELDDADGRAWSASIVPLEGTIRALMLEYLPRLRYPIRSGVHSNTPFALAQALDYARARRDDPFERAIVEWSQSRYASDRNSPIGYEPSGEDFLSPALTEADLMRRVLAPDRFSAWLDGFLPMLRQGSLGGYDAPVEVSDETDGRLVHLAGLNLSRAWAMRGVASRLEADDPRRQVLEHLGAAHVEAGLAKVFTGRYEGEHWLASFAVYALTDVGIAPAG